MGGNFAAATPDTEVTFQALRNCQLNVSVATKLNRNHLVAGNEALILPCFGRTEIDCQKAGEQFVTVENSMGVVHISKGKVSPISKQLLSEVSIVCRLALKLFASDLEKRDIVDWQGLNSNYDRIRDLIEKSIPGFDRYNERVNKPNGFYLPNPVRDKLEFKTNTGKGNFTVHDIPLHKLQDDQFLMMTVRSHDQYNTTIYGLNDRYRGIFYGRRVVLMNSGDVARMNLKQGDVVNLSSDYNHKVRMAEKFVVVPYDIPRQCIATYFPEANVLVPVELIAKKSHTPVSKSVIVKVEK